MRRTTLLLAVLAASLFAAPASADRETAQFSSNRGDKAVAAKKYEEAEGLYRKAIEEDETYLPARYGLAQALLGEGQSAAAVEELRKFVDAAHAAAALPPEWKTVLAKAEKQLGDLDAAGTALQKIQDGYADALADLGQRWMAKDPLLAERALRRALKLHPAHAKATDLLAKMGKSANSEVIDLFDGTTLGGWESANPPTWSVADGEMVAAARDGTFYCRSLRVFEGDFDVHAEMRVVEEYAGQVYFGLMPCFKAEYDHYGFGCIRGKVWWSDTTDQQSKPRDIAYLTPNQLKKPFDPKQWNTFELRCRGKEVTALVNGDEVAKEPRPDSRKSGFVGLIAQSAKVAFRKIQVEVR